MSSIELTERSDADLPSNLQSEGLLPPVGEDPTGTGSSLLYCTMPVSPSSRVTGSFPSQSMKMSFMPLERVEEVKTPLN